MNDVYRINVRFDLANEKEARAAEHLRELKENGGKSRNRFIVDAIIKEIESKHDRCFTHDELRRIIREELKTVSLARAEPEKKTAPLNKELNEEQKAKTAASALSFLSNFGKAAN